MIRIVEIVGLLLLFALQLSAQQTYKESKLFSKSYDYKEGEKIRVTGERTFITISVWPEDKVQAEVEVVSRSGNQAQAKVDLEKVKVSFQKKGKTIYYNNALRIQSEKDKPKSNLKTILHLYVPATAIMDVSSSFGEVTLDGAITELLLKSQFSNLGITHFDGKLEIESKYDKVECSDTKGSLNFKGNRTDLSLIRSENEITVRLDYGNLDIVQLQSSGLLSAETHHTPITLILPKDNRAGIELNCDGCDINMDNCNSITDEEIKKNRHKVKISNTGNQNSRIESYQGDITIITTNSITTAN